jgi:hypothetical protein
MGSRDEAPSGSHASLILYLYASTVSLLPSTSVYGEKRLKYSMSISMGP